jgi:alpha-1,6-mannosyltransferase
MVASADALLHCSTAETFGFVVAEALCSGTPVIVPEAAGAGDLAAPEYAETYAPGDANSAADAILRLLERDRAALSYAALDAGARRIGDIDSHFETLFAVYAQVARRKRVGQAGHMDRMVPVYEGA